MTQRDKAQEEISPRIHVEIDGKKYRNIKTFKLTGDVLTLSDGFSFDLPSPNGEALELIKANIHRWVPIKIWHSDPLVQQGREIQRLTGIITGAEYHTGAQASVLSIRGYDLGKLLDSCGPPWKRVAGATWGRLVNLLLDPSWLAKNHSDGWGFKGVVGVDLNRRIKLGRQGAVMAYYRKVEQFVQPIQIEVGELIHDPLARHARLIRGDGGGGSLVNVSADGYLQIMNPEDSANDPPSYVFEYHTDGRNQRIKSATLSLSGESLHTDYYCYSSNIKPPKIVDAQDPNAGKFYGVYKAPPLGSKQGQLRRRLTFADGDQYTQDLVKARATWRYQRAEYDAQTLTYVIQGHSMPGPDGKWVPLAEGTIAEVRDSRNQIFGLYYLQRVELHQAPAPQGTTAICMLKPKGLLSG